MEESLAKPIELLSKQIAFLGEKIKGTQSIVPSDGGSSFKDKEVLTPNLTPTEVNREKQKAVVFGKALGIGVYTPKGKLEDLTPDAIKAVTASATVAKQQEAGMGILKLIGGILSVGANLLSLTSAYKFLREWIPKIFGPGAKGIFDSLDIFFQPIIDFVDEMKQKFLEWFKEEFPETYKFFEDTINSIKGFFKTLKNTWTWFLEGEDSPLRDMPALEKAILHPIQTIKDFFNKLKEDVIKLSEGSDTFKGLTKTFENIKNFFIGAQGIAEDLKIVTKNLVFMVTNPKDYAYNLLKYGVGMPSAEFIAQIKKEEEIRKGPSSPVENAPTSTYNQNDTLMAPRKRQTLSMSNFLRAFPELIKDPEFLKYYDRPTTIPYSPKAWQFEDAVFKGDKAYGISSEDDIVALKSGGPLDRIFKKQDNMMVSYSRSLLEATMRQIELLAKIETNTAMSNQLLIKQKPTIVQTGGNDSSKQRIFNRKAYDVDTTPLFDYKLLA